MFENQCINQNRQRQKRSRRRGGAGDLPGSFCTKRIDRNWLGKELGDAEEETDAGADSDVAAADRGCDVTGQIDSDCVP